MMCVYLISSDVSSILIPPDSIAFYLSESTFHLDYISVAHSFPSPPSISSLVVESEQYLPKSPWPVEQLTSYNLTATMKAKKSSQRDSGKSFGRYFLSLIGLRSSDAYVEGVESKSVILTQFKDTICAFLSLYLSSSALSSKTERKCLLSREVHCEEVAKDTIAIKKQRLSTQSPPTQRASSTLSNQQPSRT